MKDILIYFLAAKYKTREEFVDFISPDVNKYRRTTKQRYVTRYEGSRAHFARRIFLPLRKLAESPTRLSRGCHRWAPRKRRRYCTYAIFGHFTYVNPLGSLCPRHRQRVDASYFPLILTAHRFRRLKRLAKYTHTTIERILFFPRPTHTVEPPSLFRSNTQDR